MNTFFSLQNRHYMKTNNSGKDRQRTKLYNYEQNFTKFAKNSIIINNSNSTGTDA